MKIKHIAIVGVTAAILTAGCATEATYTDSGDTTTAVVSGNHMSSSDWTLAVEKLGGDMLTSQEFTEYLADFAKDAEAQLKKDEAAGKTFTSRERRNALKPILMLSTIENKTGEHIETQVLTERLREIVFKSGQVRFTTYAGGDGQHIDQASRQSRDVKFDRNVKRDTLMKKNKVNSYNLSLGGTIIKQRAASGRARETSYLFTLTLTDSSSGEGVWAKTFELKRQHMRGALGY